MVFMLFGSSGGGATSTAAERQLLLKLASRSLAAAVHTGQQPEFDASELPERLRQLGACFVTLTKAGQLRGCIGQLFASRRLYESVIENAQAAALSDSRFSPVEPQELQDLEIEISLLTTPQRVEAASPDKLLNALRPGTDGVVLTLRGRRATYLPQVWEQLPDKERFLGELSRKAGLPSDAWKDPDAAVLTYQIEAIHGAYQPP